MAAEESRKGDNVALKRKEETQVVPAYEPTPQEHAVAKTYFANQNVCSERVFPAMQEIPVSPRGRSTLLIDSQYANNLRTKLLQALI